MVKREIRNGRQSGFTLIELMVVVAIIGILSALAIPILSEYRDHAKIASAKTFGLQVVNSLVAHAANSPGNAFSTPETCDDLARLVGSNGFDFSLKRQAQYCPAGTGLESPPTPGLFGWGFWCRCWDKIEGGRRRYPCNTDPPLVCGPTSNQAGPADIELVFPLLDVQDELYLLASTDSGVEVVSGDEFPVEGPVGPEIP